MDAAERDELIARYEQGHAVVVRALSDVGTDALDARPSPDDWTPREIVHHLADSEMTSAIRLRRLLAEDAPVIAGYDESAFAKRLHYERPIEASLDAFRAARGTSAQLLHVLSPEDWARTGWHTESGLYSVETWLRTYAAHGHDHAEQIRAAMRDA